VAGVDRFATAAALSASQFAPGVPRVYLATAENYPDALAAAPAAAVAGGPVLLTGRAAVPAVTLAELVRLRPREIVLVGGQGTIRPDVEAPLALLAPLRRVAGADRFATAAALAQEIGAGPVDVVYVASGEGFADALSGGATAADAGVPLLLTGRSALPPATAAALTALRPARIVVLGGRGSVDDAVLAELTALTPGGVARVSGEDRFATSAAVSRLAHPSGAATVYLATGTAFPDALAAGPVAGLRGAPLLLTGGSALPASIVGELARLRPSAIVVAGGEGAVSAEVLAAAARAAGLTG
jgi:putative cell wall-binding protein